MPGVNEIKNAHTTKHTKANNRWSSYGQLDCAGKILLSRSPLCTTPPDCDNDAVWFWIQLAYTSWSQILNFHSVVGTDVESYRKSFCARCQASIKEKDRHYFLPPTNRCKIAKSYILVYILLQYNLNWLIFILFAKRIASILLITWWFRVYQPSSVYFITCEHVE